MGQDRAEELKNVPGVQKKEEEEAKRFFSTGTGNILDDLDDWAYKLETLGGAVSFLGGNDNEDQGLDFFGERLGLIIEDYARAIEITLSDKKTRRMFSLEEAEVFPLSAHLRTYEAIRTGAYCPEIALTHIDKEIEEVNSFVEKIANPGLFLLMNLRDLRDAIIKRIESSKAKESSQKTGKEKPESK